MPNKQLDPKLAQEAVAAVKQHGNQCAAAKALGIPRATLQGRLRMADTQKSDGSRVRELEKLLEAQQRTIDQLGKARYALPKAAKAVAHKSFIRLAIPDTHGCFVDHAALSALWRDMESLGPLVREIVLLGDHLDCAGWLSKHHPFKTVQEARYSFEADVDAANAFLDGVQQRCPKAVIHYLEGNHEERLEAFVVEASAGHERDAAYLRKLFSPESLLHLETRGITYYRRTHQHGDIRRRGVLKLGHCAFLHGTNHAKHSAYQHLQQHKCCVVFGHTHRRQQAGTADLKTEIDAWCPGCLCQFEPIWKHSEPTEWSHGYGLQCVRDDGSFQHVNVAIVDGRSYLDQLIGALRTA